MANTNTEYIFGELSSCFAIESQMLQVIVEQLVDQTLNMKLNKLTIQPIFKQIRKSCPKSGLPEMNILFKCCYVLILSLREEELLFRNYEELFNDYPEFINLPADELKKLLKFRNAMKVSLQLIDARHHKGELLEIAGRLSGKLVTTGGSQTTETKRRVLIYEREGGLEVEKATGKGKKRKFDVEVKIKMEEYPSSLSKKVCTVDSSSEASFSSRRSTSSSLSTSAPAVVKAEPSLLPRPVTAFISQQLMNKFSASDAANYQAIIEKTVVQTSTNKELNKLTMRPILKELRKLFPRKEIWAEMNILFKCCYVLILSLRDDNLLWLDQRQFLENYRYPEFEGLSVDEVQKLMVFRNAMKVSLQLIEAKHHKGELLEIAGRLSGRVVTTGGGQTADTTRCVMIYEQEGGVPSEQQKVPRKPSAHGANAAHSSSSLLRRRGGQESLDNLESLMLMEGVAGLDCIMKRGTDSDVSQTQPQHLQPRHAQLERADTGMSLFGTFSLQSLGSLGRLGSLGDFDFTAPVLPTPLPLSDLAPGAPAAAVSVGVSSATSMESPAKRVCRKNRNKNRSCGGGGVGRGDLDTDIDTDLDSMEEVATEVDESEVRDDPERSDDEERRDRGVRTPVAAEQEHDTDFFDGLFRTQSAPLACTEAQHSMYGYGGSSSSSGGQKNGGQSVGGLDSLYPTETITSVDMCTGIARLGSMPSLTPDFFTNNLFAYGTVPSRSPTLRDDIFSLSPDS